MPAPTPAPRAAAAGRAAAQPRREPEAPRRRRQPDAAGRAEEPEPPAPAAASRRHASPPRPPPKPPRPSRPRSPLPEERRRPRRARRRRARGRRRWSSSSSSAAAAATPATRPRPPPTKRPPAPKKPQRRPTTAKADPGGARARSTAATPAGVAIFGRVKKHRWPCRSKPKAWSRPAKGQSYTVWLYDSPQKMLPLASTAVGEDGRIGAQVRGPDRSARLPRQRNLRPDRHLAAPTTPACKPRWPRRRKKKTAPDLHRHDVLRGTITGPIVGAAAEAGEAGEASGSAGEELAGVHDPGRVELLLDRAQHLEPGLAHLGLHVGGVVAADRVVVGDRAAAGDDRLRGGALDLPPLLELGAAAGAGDEGEVERGAVGVGVREVAEDEARACPGRRASRGSRRRPPRAARRAGSRCARSRASRPSPPSPSACRAGRGPGSGRAPRSARPPGRGRRRRRARSARTVSARRRATDSSSPSKPTIIRQPPRAAAQAEVAAEERCRRRRAGPESASETSVSSSSETRITSGRPGPWASARTISAPASKLSAIQAS